MLVATCWRSSSRSPFSSDAIRLADANPSSSAAHSVKIAGKRVIGEFRLAGCRLWNSGAGKLALAVDGCAGVGVFAPRWPARFTVAFVVVERLARAVEPALQVLHIRKDIAADLLGIVGEYKKLRRFIEKAEMYDDPDFVYLEKNRLRVKS